MARINKWLERQTQRLNFPKWVRIWLFKTETRAVELFNSITLFSWALIFIFASPDFFKDNYRNLHGHTPHIMTGTVLMIIAMLSLYAVLHSSLTWRSIQVYCLYASCVAWTCILAGLISVLPPFTFSLWLSFLVHGFLFLMSWWGAIHLQDLNRKLKEDVADVTDANS